MKKICYVATIPAVINSFLREHIQAAAEKYAVTIVCNSTDSHLLVGLRARIVFLPIERKPSARADARVLMQLYALFRSERFDIVHSHMPKTALLGMLAAWAAGVPVRINTFHGEVWATRRGWKRIALKKIDKLIGFLATELLLVSPSQKEFLVRERVLRFEKANVIGAGSVCGVDPIRFRPDENARRETRDHLGIAREAKVILFVGRLNRDKGILDLAAAFSSIAKLHSDVELMLVGSEEDISFEVIKSSLGSVGDRLHYMGFSPTPEIYMRIADIFCLPSYREGFGLSIIEAAACGVPAVASRIYGITDAVAEGETGLLFSPGDVPALSSALLALIEKNAIRKEMGNAARARVLELFSSKSITSEMMKLYDRLSNKSSKGDDKTSILELQ